MVVRISNDITPVDGNLASFGVCTQQEEVHF